MHSHLDDGGKLSFFVFGNPEKNSKQHLASSDHKFLQGHKLARGVIGNLFLNVCAQYQKKEENEEEAETDFL
jgi:hypothetical protein